MQHSGVSPSSERVGMYVRGYLFIMARAHVSKAFFIVRGTRKSLTGKNNG